MTYTKIWPEAKHALCFVRPVAGCGQEVQKRMIAKALKKLDIPHGMYESPIDGDRDNERGAMIKNMRGNEVVVLPRLNVLGRKRVEVKSSVSLDFMLCVGDILRKCDYILVLDSNMPNNEPYADNSITSKDREWNDVMERAVNQITYGRKLSKSDASKMATKRWAGEFRGVVEEWTKNPERAKELETMARVWRDPAFKSAKEAYEAMPEEVREQIKSLETARKIFGRRKPELKRGRPKKKVNGPDESPIAIYDLVDGDSIVYTGMTADPYDRFYKHKRSERCTKRGFLEVIEWHDNRVDAAKAEALRIRLLRPLNNQQHAATPKSGHERMVRSTAIY